MPVRPIDDVLKESTPRLLAIPGVVGTARGALADGRPCIFVLFASEPSATSRRKVPARLEGHVVRIDVVGDVEAR